MIFTKRGEFLELKKRKKNAIKQIKKIAIFPICKNSDFEVPNTY